MATNKKVPKTKKTKKQSSDKLSTLASDVLKGKKPSSKETKSLAGSVLSQDEKKGTRKPKGK